MAEIWLTKQAVLGRHAVSFTAGHAFVLRYWSRHRADSDASAAVEISATCLGVRLLIPGTAKDNLLAIESMFSSDEHGTLPARADRSSDMLRSQGLLSRPKNRCLEMLIENLINRRPAVWHLKTN